MFWTPAFAGVTTKEAFYELIKIEEFQNDSISLSQVQYARSSFMAAFRVQGVLDCQATIFNKAKGHRKQ